MIAAGSSSPGLAARGGFSLVEVVIALMILAIGVLAMAASTGYVTTQLGAADLNTDRAVAVRYAVERLNSLPFDSLASRDRADAETVGAFRVWWDATAPSPVRTDVRVYTLGPGYRAGDRVGDRHDTLETSIVKPYP